MYIQNSGCLVYRINSKINALVNLKYCYLLQVFISNTIRIFLTTNFFKIKLLNKKNHNENNEKKKLKNKGKITVAQRK